MSQPSPKKFFDVTLDEWLTFEGHFRMVSREIDRTFGLLRKLRNLLL